MIEFALSGLIFGFIGGVTPGPLGLVVIQQTLGYGLKNGIKAAVVPFVTDIPIILLVFFLYSKFQSTSSYFVGGISFLGALYLLWMSVNLASIKDSKVSIKQTSNSFGIALKVNLLNPNLYMFWFSVGGSYLILGSSMQAISFVIALLVTLVATKITIAWGMSKFRDVLSGRRYNLTMRFLAGALAVFSILLFSKSYKIFSSLVT